MRATVVLVAAVLVTGACAAAQPESTAAPTPSPAKQVAVGSARVSSTPTPSLPIPTREPTPDIEQMIAAMLEGHFRKLRRDDTGANFVCEKHTVWSTGIGVCLGKGDYPDNLKKISAWRFTYDASDRSKTDTEMRVFAYSTTDPLGVLQSCSGGGCDTEAMPVAQGVRLVEQTAARWIELAR